MSDRPDYFPVVSVHLSRVLDEIGLNTVTVKRRRQSYLSAEKFEIIYKTLYGDESGMTDMLYHFGSQSEGSTTPGLCSDLDTLLCRDNFNVIQDWADWQAGKMNLLMLHGDTAPGYCRLQVLRKDMPLPREATMIFEPFTCDGNNRVILKNTCIHNSFKGRGMRHGPAHSDTNMQGYMDNDGVLALKCNFPRQADQGINRHRPGDWPAQGLIEQAVQNGTFLVPLGHKLSQSESLEWRISFSVTERLLMFSMNIIQIKCYVVLKMLIKTFVTPCVGESISSYHYKTALFYCIEETGTEFWREDNLLECIAQCLAKIFSWVSNEYCPHFIIPESNLFAGKITRHNKFRLLAIIKDLIDSKGRFLLHLPINDLGRRLQMKLNAQPDIRPFLNSNETAYIVGNVEMAIQESFHVWLTLLLTKKACSAPRETIYYVHRHLSSICGRVRHCDKHERQAIRYLLEFLSCWMGSLVTSVSLSCARGIPPEGVKWFCIGARSDLASKLKLASAFYCSGKLQNVEAILRFVEESFQRNRILSICGCYDNRPECTLEFFRQMHALTSERKRSKMFARCVKFTPNEMHCAPPALRAEMFRSVGDDDQHRDQEQDRWMVLAVADCLPTLYFLQYLSYGQLGKEDLQKRSLHNLDRCVREDISLRHQATAWNLLGQCMELENKLEVSMDCYRTSLEVRPRNNAANRHMQILGSKMEKK